MEHILGLGVQNLMKNLKLQTDYKSEDEMYSEIEMGLDQDNEIEVDQDNDEAISEDCVIQI